MTTAGSAHQDGWPDADSHVRLPDATRVFEVRAARFRALEVGHAAGPYLRLLGALADSQARSCQDMPTSLDSAELLSPLPLDARAWRRADAWRRALDGILEQLAGVAPPRDTAASLARLAGMGTEQRERTAGAVLAQASHEDEASAVFVASALQVYWTSLAELVPADRLTPDQMTGCPVCGSPPVAGLVAASHTLRHLACSLCATRWHRTRLTCVHCGSTSDLAVLRDRGRAVRREGRGLRAVPSLPEALLPRAGAGCRTGRRRRGDGRPGPANGRRGVRAGGGQSVPAQSGATIGPPLAGVSGGPTRKVRTFRSPSRW